MKLQHKITLYAIVGITLGFSAFSFINFKMMKEATKTEIHNKLITEALSTKQNIEEWLNHKMQITTALGHTLQGMEEAPLEQIKNTLS